MIAPDSDTDPATAGDVVTAGKISGYLAKYLIKDLPGRERALPASNPGVFDRAAHSNMIMDTCLALARVPHLAELQLTRHLASFGCSAHICTRSRSYSSSLSRLRAEQRAYAAELQGIDVSATVAVDSSWTYAGSGWANAGEANYAHARAVERIDGSRARRHGSVDDSGTADVRPTRG